MHGPTPCGNPRQRRFFVGTIPPDFLRAERFRECLTPDVLELIRIESRCLARRLRRPYLGHEDIEQEILLDLWQRWTEFDAARSHERTFLRRVVRNKVVEIRRHHNRQKRRGDHHVLSFDQFVSYGIGQDNDSEQDDPCPNNLPVAPSDETLIELTIDLATVLTALPQEHRQVCERLAAFSLIEVRRYMGVSKYYLHQWIVELRQRFTIAGLHHYL